MIDRVCQAAVYIVNLFDDYYATLANVKSIGIGRCDMHFMTDHHGFSTAQALASHSSACPPPFTDSRTYGRSAISALLQEDSVYTEGRLARGTTIIADSGLCFAISVTKEVPLSSDTWLRFTGCMLSMV